MIHDWQFMIVYACHVSAAADLTEHVVIVLSQCVFYVNLSMPENTAANYEEAVACFRVLQT